MQYEPGLIRYTSDRAMQDGLSAQSARSHLLRPRVLIYGTLILILAVAFVASLAMRNPLRVDVIRDRGALGREVAGGQIENVYRLQIINTSDTAMRLRLSADGMPGLQVMAGRQGSDTVDVEAAANKLVPMVIRAPAGIEPGAHPITLRARGHDGENRSIQTDEPASFYVPE
ncbi:Ubp3 associated protein Bre5 [compost metagenome]